MKWPWRSHDGKSRKGKRMTNVSDCDKAHAEEGCHYYSWLEDYLERLEGKETYRKFQEGRYDDSGYYALIVSLAA
jgi:hypothetical protein